MPRLGRWIGRGLFGLGALAAALWFLGPREPAERLGPVSPTLTADPQLLAEREANIPDIVPGAEARIVWAGEPGTETRWTVLYLHGFSASAEELRPVPDRVAEALGANLIFARLPGHGRDGAALGEATAAQWIGDTDFMLDLARAIGDRVLVIGTSTGGTLAAFAATEPDMAVDIAGIVFVSPNFRLAAANGVLIEWPLARTWVPWVIGPERSFEPVNEAQARYWTERYPSVATVVLGALMRETRARDFAGVTIPGLFLFAEDDSVVSAEATRAVAEGWGGPVTLAPQDLPEDGVDPYRHVIAGDVLSPAMTGPVTEQILTWVGGLQD